MLLFSTVIFYLELFHYFNYVSLSLLAGWTNRVYKYKCRYPHRPERVSAPLEIHACELPKEVLRTELWVSTTAVSSSNPWTFLFVCWLDWVGFLETRFICLAIGCPGTHSVDQAGLRLKDLPASVSRALGLKACATRSCSPCTFLCGYRWTVN